MKVKVGDYVTAASRYGVFTGFVATVEAAPLSGLTGKPSRPRLVTIELPSTDGQPNGATFPEWQVEVLPQPVA